MHAEKDIRNLFEEKVIEVDDIRIPNLWGYCGNELFGKNGSWLLLVKSKNSSHS